MTLLPPDALRGMRLGISVSESTDLGRLGLLEEHFRLALGEITRVVLVSGGGSHMAGISALEVTLNSSKGNCSDTVGVTGRCWSAWRGRNTGSCRCPISCSGGTSACLAESSVSIPMERRRTRPMDAARPLCWSTTRPYAAVL